MIGGPLSSGDVAGQLSGVESLEQIWPGDSDLLIEPLELFMEVKSILGRPFRMHSEMVVRLDNHGLFVLNSLGFNGPHLIVRVFQVAD